MIKNRRDFIINLGLSVMGYALKPDFIVNTTNFNRSDLTLSQKLRQAAQKRKNGNLNGAKSLYQEIILSNPNEIRAYDGLRLTLLKEKFQELAVLNLYISGLNANPENIVFKKRISSEYMRLALGNKKFTNQLTISNDVLLHAKSILEDLKIQLPNDNEVDQKLEKLNKKIQFNTMSIDSRSNPDQKMFKKENRGKYKKRFDAISVDEVKIKLNKLLNSEDTITRDKHIRELYKILIRKLRRNENLEEANIYQKELYNFNNKDQHALKIIRLGCKKDQKWEKLIEIERLNNQNKNSFWSNITLFDAIVRHYRKSGIGNIEEMKSILERAKELRFTFYQKYEYRSRDLRFSVVIGNKEEIYDKMKDFASSLIGVQSAHFINKFMRQVARIHYRWGDIDTTLKVIDISLGTYSEDDDNDFLKLLILVNKNKNHEKDIHDLKMINYKDRLLKKGV